MSDRQHFSDDESEMKRFLRRWKQTFIYRVMAAAAITW